MNLLLLATEGGGFPDPLPVEEFFNFKPFLFENSDWFALNRTGLLYLLAAAITCGLVIVAFGNAKIVPGKFQAAMEGLVDLVRDNIIGEVIGPKGQKFLPLMFSLFMFIFVCNFFEIMPFINFPPTSRMAVPLLLALIVWTVFNLAGVKANGFFGYLKAVSIPPGVPPAILLLVIPIEIISTFLLRPFTHAVRLFANMMAGHILLTVAFLAANAFLIDFHDFGAISLNVRGLPIGIVSFLGAVAFVAFELVVGILQAYIFTILTAVYIGGSIAPEH